MLLTYKPHCQGEVLWGNWVTHCFFFLFPNPLILVLQSREKSFVQVQFRALWFSISHLQSCEKSLLWQRAFLLWAINWLRCDSNMVNSLILTSLSSPVFRTSVKTSYMVRTSQNSLEAYRYIDCGSNTTYQQPENYKIHSSGDTTALSLRHSLPWGAQIWDYKDCVSVHCRMD